MLTRLVRQIVGSNQTNLSHENIGDVEDGVQNLEINTVPLDEVVEIMEFPKAAGTSSERRKRDPKLNSHVKHELYAMVSNIAALYNDNHFHGFEHASHVTMSVVKLLSRVVTPSTNKNQLDSHTESFTQNSTASGMLDPLTQFACVFAALVHDVDHQGM
jgi:hypothetical protein